MREPVAQTRTELSHRQWRALRTVLAANSQTKSSNSARNAGQFVAPDAASGEPLNLPSRSGSIDDTAAWRGASRNGLPCISCGTLSRRFTLRYGAEEKSGRKRYEMARHFGDRPRSGPATHPLLIVSGQMHLRTNRENHSYLSATIGSTRIARRAGM